jgi:Uma2 family endonuclease
MGDLRRFLRSTTMTSSAIIKMQLFAAMGVPEVWRHDGHRLQMFELVDGSYLQIPSSLQFCKWERCQKRLHNVNDANTQDLLQ